MSLIHISRPGTIICFIGVICDKKLSELVTDT
jgi:hypothetical protein